MSRSLKIVCLAIGGAAFIVLGVLGFAIWVFIPILPAAIVFLIALVTLQRRPPSSDPAEAEEEQSSRKAA
jgi:hypothetical protein